MTNTLTRIAGIVAILAVLVAAVPAVMQGRVAEDDWQPLTTTLSSNTEATSVSKVHLPQQLDRMQRVNGELLAVMYPAGCANIDCATRDVGVVRNGEMKIIRGLPAYSLDAERVLDSDGRILWTEETDSSARFDVWELDVHNATISKLAADVFLGDAVEARVLAEADRLYFEVYGVNELAPGIRPVIIRQSRIGENVKDTTEMNRQWRKSLEEIQDVSDNGQILTRMTFEGGDQELWVHSRPIEQGVVPRPASVAIDGSYTINGHLVGAHFVDEDTIEFFRYQSLMRYTISTGALEDLGERLYWVADQTQQEALVITADDTMYYVDQDEAQAGGITVRKDDLSTSLGYAGPGNLWIDNGFVTAVVSRVLQTPDRGLVTTHQLHNYDADSATITLSFAGATDLDEYGSARAWIDSAGNVRWSHTDASGQGTGAILGSGTRVFMTGEAEMMWVGFDGQLYSGTVRPSAITTPSDEVFYKLDGSTTVYRVADDTRWIVPNESTFYTWAESFNVVQTVPASWLDGYANGGFLQMKPGTMIKTATSPHVQVVQNDWHKQRIANETVAHAIYGDHWWHHILTVEPDVMNQYQEIAGPIDSVDEYVQNL